MGSNSHSFLIESSSTFTVPKGVKKIDVFCVGGGGSGVLRSDTFSYTLGGGGGGGYTSTKLGVDVEPGQVLSVVVGSASSTSSVGSICSATGGTNGYCRGGGNGGSGGGEGYWYTYDGGVMSSGTAGGVDGGDGIGSLAGKGQGTTTRYFGESNGTLYASGGSGGRAITGYRVIAANTGDGSDGENGKDGLAWGLSAGGSGICIIRWSGK